MMSQIIKMHMKFCITPEKVPFTEKEKIFRIAAMQEELDEFVDAESKEEQLDALVDLVVFTLGTAYRMGWGNSFETAYCRVMEANLDKELGSNSNKEDTRGSFHLDLVKPKGWKPADLSDLV